MFVSPSRAPTSPPHPTLVPALHLDEEFTELEKLAIVWEACHIAYYESMDFKEKIDKREASARASQVFWSAFEDFCKDVLQNSNSNGEVFDACMNLQKRRQLRCGISMSESTLSKLTQHNSISMYSDTDFKIKFELQARRFWMDWDLLEAAIERCSLGPEKEHTKAFAEIYGRLDFNKIKAPTDPCIESFIHNETFSTFTIQQLRRMCYHGVDGPEEEIELLEQRENVDKTLFAYQRLYMSS